MMLCTLPLARAESTLIDSGYRHMYNLQFDEAHRVFAEWRVLHPESALGPASDAAAYLFAEFDRLHILQSEFFTHDDHFTTDHRLAPDPSLKRKFDAALAAAESLAARSPSDPDARFSAVLCHGLRSDYLALIEKRYMSSFTEMKNARAIAGQLLRSQPDYYDAWVAVGVENYMLSIKPVFLRWFLRLNGGQTDGAAGLSGLRLAAEKGRYLAPLARLMLAVAAMRNRDSNRARQLLSALAVEFPQNTLYRQELARLGQQP